MKRHSPEVVRVNNVRVRVYHRRTNVGERYEVADYSTGTRVLRGFSDRGKARAEAGRIGRLMAAGEAHAARMSGREAASFGRAIELLKPTGVPLELAAARFADAWTRLGGDRLTQAVDEFLERQKAAPRRKPVREVVNDLIASKSGDGKSPRYLADLRSKLARFEEAFQTDIAAVTGPGIQHWLDNLPGAPVTKKGFRSVIHLLFSFAETRGDIARGSNPVALTERVTMNGGDIRI